MSTFNFLPEISIKIFLREKRHVSANTIGADQDKGLQRQWISYRLHRCLGDLPAVLFPAIRRAFRTERDDPELTQAYGLTTLGVSSVIGLYYYTYSTFALVSGAALDRWGAKYTIPTGIFLLAVGIIMFGIG